MTGKTKLMSKMSFMIFQRKLVSIFNAVDNLQESDMFLYINWMKLLRHC